MIPQFAKVQPVEHDLVTGKPKQERNEVCREPVSNRNGVTSWRGSGWLHGVRIRKNFLTKEEAAAEKASLAIKAVQVSAGSRPFHSCNKLGRGLRKQVVSTAGRRTRPAAVSIPGS